MDITDPPQHSINLDFLFDHAWDGFFLQWEGVFVPVVPLTLMDVLDSPVPALVGVQAPFDPLSYALDGVVVLDLDARQSSVGWFAIPISVDPYGLRRSSIIGL